THNLGKMPDIGTESCLLCLLFTALVAAAIVGGAFLIEYEKQEVCWPHCEPGYANVTVAGGEVLCVWNGSASLQVPSYHLCHVRMDGGQIAAGFLIGFGIAVIPFWICSMLNCYDWCLSDHLHCFCRVL